MEIFKHWTLFGVHIYVSSIRMKRRRSVDEKLRNKNKTLRRYKNILYAEQEGCCGDCGKFAPVDGLEIHHIIGVSEAPGLMLKKRNMVLLCPSCHRERHRRDAGGTDSRGGKPRGADSSEKGGSDGELQ